MTHMEVPLCRSANLGYAKKQRLASPPWHHRH